MITSFLSIGEFFERYQTFAILLVLGFILIIALYIKKYFPKLFDNNEGLKSQDELDKEELENMLQTQKIEIKKEEDNDNEDEEETYFINDTNREKIKKMKNKD